jgi:menaquinone-dependent protoporphyrinogen IX oxidase
VKTAEIKGYRELSEQDIELVNLIKEAEIQVGTLWRVVVGQSTADRRWTAVAKTHFQEGFTALVRSVTKPEDVF